MQNKNYYIICTFVGFPCSSLRQKQSELRNQDIRQFSDFKRSLIRGNMDLLLIKSSGRTPVSRYSSFFSVVYFHSISLLMEWFVFRVECLPYAVLTLR